MLWAGIICLLIAAGVAVFAYFQHREHQELVATETSTCGDLRELADAVASEVGGGNFSQKCELNGSSKPQTKALSAPYSDQACVWYRTTVTEEYWDWEYRGEGDNRRRERVRKERVLQSSSSEDDFLIDDGTGVAVISPKGADVDSPRPSFNEYESEPKGSFLEQLGSSLLNSDDRIGIRREEWIVPPDVRLFVQGEVTDSEKLLRIREPDKGKFRVSLRSEEELAKSAASGKKWATVGAGALGAVGVGLTIAGIVTA